MFIKYIDTDSACTFFCNLNLEENGLIIEGKMYLYLLNLDNRTKFQKVFKIFTGIQWLKLFFSRFGENKTSHLCNILLQQKKTC